jgi:hypothetical protein
VLARVRRADLIDRILRGLEPGFDAAYTPPPKRIADGVWTIERKLRMPAGLVMPIASPLLRLPDGTLLLSSPPKPDAALVEAIHGLGRLGAILAPNSFHHLTIPDALRAFPDAALFLAPGLATRVPTLPAGTELAEEPPAAWGGAIETVVFRPGEAFSEVVLFHRPSATLVLTDLGFNMRRFASAYDRLGWRLFGIPVGFGASRTARLTLFSERPAATTALRRVASWPFERILVAHGDAVERDARGEFERAYARWLG